MIESYDVVQNMLNNFVTVCVRISLVCINSLYYCNLTLKSALPFYFICVVLTVQFSKSTFSGDETTGVVTVTLLLGEGTSDSDISVIVTPSDQSPVSAHGKIMTYID